MNLFKVSYRIRGNDETTNRWFATKPEAVTFRDSVASAHQPTDFYPDPPRISEQNVPTTRRKLALWLDLNFGG